MIAAVCEDRSPTRVLEVGAGCGYQAAVLAQFVREVHTIERIRGLYELAREHLRALRLTTRIRLIYGDGMLGLPGVAPFDAIVVAAAGLAIPQALLSQLAPGGRLIAPEGGSNQRLVLIERTGAASWKRTELEAVRFCAATGRNTILSKQEKRMLNGQLQLTDITTGASMTRLRRPLYIAGALSLAILAGCASKGTRAPVVDMTGGQPAPAAQPGGSYVVKPGDTLYKIARANNVDVENVKRWNNLSDPNQISVGQVLKMSGSAGGAAQTTPVGGAKVLPRPLDQPETLPPPTTETTTPPPTAPVETKPATRAADAAVINWAWPASGQIVQGFNNSTKGIDISGALGDPITAAADGLVKYSGNGVRGLGNLIIVEHQNGFITAYAHNRALLVKTGQNVKRGAKIAELGQSDATSPRLHFEIRRQGQPVDPMQYLPAR